MNPLEAFLAVRLANAKDVDLRIRLDDLIDVQLLHDLAVGGAHLEQALPLPARQFGPGPQVPRAVRGDRVVEGLLQAPLLPTTIVVLH